MAGGDISSLIGICVSSLRCLSLLALFGIAFALVLGYIVYALYCHPLAKYPGPLLGRLTQWYDVYHAYKGDKHTLFYRLHQQYGPVVRFSPNSLSINDPAALKVIYAHSANVQKSVFYKCFRARPDAISTLLAIEKAHHARKRRVMGQAFSDTALRGLEQYVLGHVQDLVERISGIVGEGDGEKQRWSGPCDMAKMCNWLVFDIMGDLVFGKSFGTLGEHPENREGIRLLGRAAKRNYVVAAMPILADRLEKWLPGFRQLYLDRLKYLAFGKAQVQARTKENGFGETGRRDIFSFLLHAKDPETGEGFPMPELWMEGNTLIVAGSDTSSTTMAAILFYLVHNPTALSRLESEIRSTFTSAEDIRMGPQLQSCAWLRACIDESMRMTPAVPGLLPREVLKGGLSIPAMDLDLPAGIDVGVPIYAIHHNAEYVVQPFKFDPARWFASESHEQDREALNAVFCPFSLGHRACLGKPLVYMELGIAIARLVMEFDMRLAPQHEAERVVEKKIKQGMRSADEYQTKDWFLSANESLFVEFRRRRM